MNDFLNAGKEVALGKDMFGSNSDKMMNPGNVDENLWEKAKKASIKEYGDIKWSVVTYLYKKMGGTFE